MRKKQLEITDRAAIDEILYRARIGRLATIGADGFPYITPLNYVYWQGSIYFHCALTGEKLDNIARDPRVCFTVDIPLSYLDLDYFGDYPEGCRVHQFYHCVIIRGRAEIVDEPREKSGALNALVASHEPKGRGFQPITPDTDAYSICAVVAVRIESITGKADLAQKKSVEEKQKLSEFFKKRGLPEDRETAILIKKHYSP
ncbi:MAG: pyridoxamine 5'-phosphate oxidase family protein [Desulfofustis sp. PB-SRB1]|jgi:nitroimidazol reductase NimA-like FMN-containing flavoprotein (pyridoxamine 5'-phosphate oxidase superfamily)|nr:pyridoxamine 5'-phosphate oxidase family protein [Desulfofustis sp. PB-SRB1]MBM1002587.1 pyridoxamine 5'-phosphate oxidase family protein [Desulfofustis sp. PB-SRB1]HBH27915.1 pyridoxamine 5'-phosphate oxidase family protein [Desulfofustis sp.]HBH31392.1 pyridoxamine 5'-phosphate oxidase family protein [Desulfofustis sp.]